MMSFVSILLTLEPHALHTSTVQVSIVYKVLYTAAAASEGNDSRLDLIRYSSTNRALTTTAFNKKHSRQNRALTQTNASTHTHTHAQCTRTEICSVIQQQQRHGTQY